jgi:hypothetical protein
MGKTIEIKRGSSATASDDPACFNRLHWAIALVQRVVKNMRFPQIEGVFAH